MEDASDTAKTCTTLAARTIYSTGKAIAFTDVDNRDLFVNNDEAMFMYVDRVIPVDMANFGHGAALGKGWVASKATVSSWRVHSKWDRVFAGYSNGSPVYNDVFKGYQFGEVAQAQSSQTAKVSGVWPVSGAGSYNTPYFFEPGDWPTRAYAMTDETKLTPDPLGFGTEKVDRPWELVDASDPYPGNSGEDCSAPGLAALKVYGSPGPGLTAVRTGAKIDGYSCVPLAYRPKKIETVGGVSVTTYGSMLDYMQGMSRAQALFQTAANAGTAALRFKYEVDDVCRRSAAPLPHGTDAGMTALCDAGGINRRNEEIKYPAAVMEALYWIWSPEEPFSGIDMLDEVFAGSLSNGAGVIPCTPALATDACVPMNEMVNGSLEMRNLIKRALRQRNSILVQPLRGSLFTDNQISGTTPDHSLSATKDRISPALLPMTARLVHLFPASGVSFSPASSPNDQKRLMDTLNAIKGGIAPVSGAADTTFEPAVQALIAAHATAAAAAKTYYDQTVGGQTLSQRMNAVGAQISAQAAAANAAAVNVNEQLFNIVKYKLDTTYFDIGQFMYVWQDEEPISGDQRGRMHIAYASVQGDELGAKTEGEYSDDRSTRYLVHAPIPSVGKQEHEGNWFEAKETRTWLRPYDDAHDGGGSGGVNFDVMDGDGDSKHHLACSEYDRDGGDVACKKAKNEDGNHICDDTNAAYDATACQAAKTDCECTGGAGNWATLKGNGQRIRSWIRVAKFDEPRSILGQTGFSTFNLRKVGANDGRIMFYGGTGEPWVGNAKLAAAPNNSLKRRVREFLAKKTKMYAAADTDLCTAKQAADFLTTGQYDPLGDGPISGASTDINNCNVAAARGGLILRHHPKKLQTGNVDNGGIVPLTAFEKEEDDLFKDLYAFLKENGLWSKSQMGVQFGGTTGEWQVDIDRTGSDWAMIATASGGQGTQYQEGVKENLDERNWGDNPSRVGKTEADWNT